MKKIIILALLVIMATSFDSCVTYQEKQENNKLEKVNLPKSVELPKDGSTPVAGMTPSQTPSQTITFKGYGEKVNVKTGETVNFVYDGIDPDQSYVMYESTDDGYTLTLAKLNQQVEVEFTRLCQTYVVASYKTTNVNLADDVKYEQIVWTPREDGTWEVRIGTTSRGCKSEALDRLNRLRNREYEANVKKTKMK